MASVILFVASIATIGTLTVINRKKSKRIVQLTYKG